VNGGMVGHSDAQAHKRDGGDLTFAAGAATKGNTNGGGPRSDGRSYGKK
jgi:hypothetical protein